MWLKVERLVSIQVSVVKEMQTNLRDFLSEPEVEDNWLDASPDDMEKIRDLVQEDLVKPTANLADLMYKSVEIRDSRYVPSLLVQKLSSNICYGIKLTSAAFETCLAAQSLP